MICSGLKLSKTRDVRKTGSSVRVGKCLEFSSWQENVPSLSWGGNLHSASSCFWDFGTILSLCSELRLHFSKACQFLGFEWASTDANKTFPWWQATFLSNSMFLYHSVETQQLLTEPLLKKSLNLRGKVCNSLTLRNTVIDQKINTRSHSQMHVRMKTVWGIHSEWGSFKMKTSFTMEGGYWLWLGFCLHFSHPVNTRERE